VATRLPRQQSWQLVMNCWQEPELCWPFRISEDKYNE